MTKDLYEKALFAAAVERSNLLDERDQLDARRAEVESRLAQLDSTIEGLQVLAGETPNARLDVLAGQVKGLGLADACRTYLKLTDRFTTPRAVRDTLHTVGYSFGNQANPLASIHAILKRFVESGEAESLEISGKIGYRLKSTPKTDNLPPPKLQRTSDVPKGSPSPTYEGLGLKPPKTKGKINPGKRDVSVLEQREKKE